MKRTDIKSPKKTPKKTPKKSPKKSPKKTLKKTPKKKGKQIKKPIVHEDTMNEEDFKDNYDIEKESEDIIEFLRTPIINDDIIIKIADEDLTDEDQLSTDDEQIQIMMELLDPELKDELDKASLTNQLKSKMFFDHKIVSPYLMGLFVNGHLEPVQCTLLKDRKSRRQLFYSLN